MIPLPFGEHSTATTVPSELCWPKAPVPDCPGPAVKCLATVHFFGEWPVLQKKKTSNYGQPNHQPSPTFSLCINLCLYLTIKYKKNYGQAKIINYHPYHKLAFMKHAQLNQSSPADIPSLHMLEAKKAVAARGLARSSQTSTVVIILWGFP